LIRRMSVENPLWGAPRIHANCSSSGLRSRSRPSPSTWSNGVGRQAKDGAPFCVVVRRAVQPWTYSLCQRLASKCSMPSSSFG
jgi:hypothetical protein